MATSSFDQKYEEPYHVLSNKTVKSYIKKFITYTKPIDDTLRLMSGEACPVCRTNMILAHNPDWNKWLETFKDFMVMMPLFRSITAVYAGIYIDAWVTINRYSPQPLLVPQAFREWEKKLQIRMKNNRAAIEQWKIKLENDPDFNDSQLKKVLFSKITPEWFLKHFVYAPCWLNSSDSHPEAQNPDHVQMFTMINGINYANYILNRIVTDSPPEAQVAEVELHQKGSKIKPIAINAANYVKNTKRCRDQCSDVSAMVYYSVRERLDSSPVSRKTMFGILYTEQPSAGEIQVIEVEDVGDNESISDNACTQNETQINTMVEDSEISDDELFRTMLGKEKRKSLFYEPVAIIKVLCSPSPDNCRSRLNLYRWGVRAFFPVVTDEGKENPQNVDCIVCNMGCFVQFFNVIQFISSQIPFTDITNTPISPANAYEEYFRTNLEKCITSQEKQQNSKGDEKRDKNTFLLRFLFEEIGPNAFYHHFHSSPVCHYNWNKLKCLHGDGINDPRNVHVPCERALLAAVLYELFIPGDLLSNSLQSFFSCSTDVLKSHKLNHANLDMLKQHLENQVVFGQR